MKSVIFNATLPELKSGAMYQTGKGVGASMASAGKRAWANLLKQPKLKAKRYSMMTITVAMGTVPEEAGKASGIPECTVNTLFGTEATAKEDSCSNVSIVIVK